MFRIKKITSSTLPETIISLIILLTSFSIAVMLISSLYKETISEKDTLVHIKMQEFKSKTIFEKKFFDETIIYNDLKLVKTVATYSPNLLLVKFYALNLLNDTLEKQQRYVYLPLSSNSLR